MKKIILVLFVFLCQKSIGQVYQLMPQYGYQAARMLFDSTLQIPTFCGVPTLKSVQFVTKKAAIAFDSCNNRFYTYNPTTLTWSQVSGGGGSTDTTSLSNRINLKLNISDTAAMLNPYLKKIDTATLSNRINLKIDSVKRRRDSVFAYRNGTEVFQYKDSVGTNPPPNGYYGAFQDTTTQTAVSINTAYGVKLGVTDLSNGVTISNNTRIKIANAGIYNIQFSLQLEKTGGSGNMIADIWLRKNGVNLQGTTGKVVLTGSANASPVVAAWNYVIAVSSNDSLELMWSTSNDNVVIKASPATSPHPSIPSAILTVTQQSGIMAGTGISPLDTANMLLPYLRKTDTSSLQQKSLPANSIVGNATYQQANAQSIFFKDTSGTYSGTITWNGTAPTIASHTYRWTRIGKMVTLNISLVYSLAGSANSTLNVVLPSDCPTPVEPTGLTANSSFMYNAVVKVFSSFTTLTALTERSGFRKNSAGNGYEINVALGTGTTAVGALITLTYYTN